MPSLWIYFAYEIYPNLALEDFERVRNGLMVHVVEVNVCFDERQGTGIHI